ncbi:MAG TPA: group I intron-associated PD-(D/E)XK endonuclease [Pyrinomonadaceae bacterium]|nr:group I intron-associated PD-(D/E)XK endonuclease [Pyrinomonadaceae bacterium]
MHELKVKGDIALAFAIARLTELGWNVGVLLTEHARYDLLAEKAGRVARVQVRSGKLRDGFINVNLRNSYADKNGTHTKLRAAGEYDLLAVYCPGTREVYFLEDSNLGTNANAVCLRVEPARNGQQKRIRPASDFLTI